MADTGSCGATSVIGRDYFTHQAETLLKLAKSATDPEVAASLIEKAADVQALVDELGAALDPNPQAPDVESSKAASVCLRRLRPLDLSMQEPFCKARAYEPEPIG